MFDRKVRSSRASLGIALLVGLATLSAAPSASASSKFPAMMQATLTKMFPGTPFCVPLCTACHRTTTGGPQNLNVFGENLYHQPMFPNLIGGAPTSAFEKALTTYFAATPAAGLPAAMTKFPDGTTRLSYDADGDGISDYDELKVLDSPSIRGANGVAQFCPSDTAMYGCFARVAAAPPPTDRWGLLSAALVVLGLTAFRRRARKR